MFSESPFACLVSMKAAVQPNSLWNSQKTFYKTFLSQVAAPECTLAMLYLVDAIIHILVRLRILSVFNPLACSSSTSFSLKFKLYFFFKCLSSVAEYQALPCLSSLYKSRITGSEWHPGTDMRYPISRTVIYKVYHTVAGIMVSNEGTGRRDMRQLLLFPCVCQLSHLYTGARFRRGKLDWKLWWKLYWKLYLDSLH